MSDFAERPSHRGPDDQPIPLPRHSHDVIERVRALVPEDARTPDGASLQELASRVALVHDAGKLTPWFRQHLDDESPNGPKHHAPIGALLVHYVLETCGFDGEDPLVGFVAVARHHGSLPNVGRYTYDATTDQKQGHLQRLYHEDVPEQIGAIDDTVPNLAASVVAEATDGDGSWSEFVAIQDEAPGHWSVTDHVSRTPPYVMPSSDPVSDGFYAAVLQVWSALVFADKTSAASLTTGVPVEESAYRSTRPSRTALEAYVRNLQRTAGEADLGDRERKLNDRREEARRSVRTRVETFLQSEESVATLTLPTGLGKTLTGLDAALAVLEDGKRDHGRVVYALPFTSIIDQVAAEARDVFAADGDGDLLTVDHHLEETVVELDHDGFPEEVPDDDLAHVAEMLGESWRSGLVVTTFVQLFESLAGPTNGQSMKLPALYDSVVILDEPQALPEDWWPLVRRLGDVLTDEYGATVIAMTATQPHIFHGDDGDAPFELVEDPGQYFEGLDRVKFELHRSVASYLAGDPEPVPYGLAAGTLDGALSESKSALAICNTIDSARQLARAVTETVDAVQVNEVYGDLLADCEATTADVGVDALISSVLDERMGNQPLVVHLSTRHRPCDRQHLIDASSRLAERGYPIGVVSTQLVEAGVDISFDRVFRDFAPLDSIVQAAGRCNRSFDRQQGRVTAWLLEPPDGTDTMPASAIYGINDDSLTKLTALALEEVWDGDPLPERTVTRDAVADYFRRLDDRNPGESEYVDHVDEAKAAKLGRLSMIDQQQAVDVVVARTPEEWCLVREIENAFEAADWDRVDELLAWTKPLNVSVPLHADDDAAEKLMDCPPVHPGAERRRVDGRPGHSDGFFDPTEGFVFPDSTVEARLL